jgi:hypothetical protein
LNPFRILGSEKAYRGVLFPLDGCRGFAGDVEADAVDAFDFVDDAAGEFFQEVVGEFDPVGGHAVAGFDGADGDGVVVGAFVAHDADAADGEEDGEALPDFVVPAAAFHFFADDAVGGAEDREAFGGDFTQNADGEAGAGERLAEDDFFGEAEFEAELADFVFEEAFEGLDEFEFHALGEAADVVVAFDHGGGVAGDGDGFDDVGIEGSLGEEFGVADFFHGVFEDFDEGASDDFAFAFGFGDAFEALEEEASGVFVVELDFEVLAEDFADDAGFAVAEDAVVDEDAGELVADGLMDEGGGDAGVDSAAEAEDDAFGADLLADFVDGVVDVVVHGPVAAAAADAVDEVADDFSAAGCVDDFGVELEAVEFLCAVFDGGVVGVFGDGDGFEAGGEFGEFVAVGVPDLEGFGQCEEEGAVGVGDFEGAFAVFAFFAAFDFAAEVMGEELEAVADAKDGDAEGEDVFVGQRGFVAIDAGGAAGEDDAVGLEGCNVLGGSVIGENGAVYVGFANTPRNDLRVLRTKIQNNNLFLHGSRQCCLFTGFDGEWQSRT